MGGCGLLVERDGQFIRWYKGEDGVVYHPQCKPDTTKPPPPMRERMRNRLRI